VNDSEKLDLLRVWLERIRNFGHAESCTSIAPVYECCCFKLSQAGMAERALREAFGERA
jgi:hypothetical protein